ncbi:MAG TPA: hypothetical protein DCY57_06050 [Bacteroidetes bacterium]|nr:hypothetical protein [Bacteroidota bacterium]
MGIASEDASGRTQNRDGKIKDKLPVFFNIRGVDKKWAEWINTTRFGLPGGVFSAYNGVRRKYPIHPFSYRI